MTDAPLVVLDACVLANFSLCDTLLRLAEPPRLYEPRWSEQIIAETVRTLESKLGWPRSLTQYLQTELRAHFDDAWVSGHEPLIPSGELPPSIPIHSFWSFFVRSRIWSRQSWKHRLPIGDAASQKCSTSWAPRCPVS